MKYHSSKSLPPKPVTIWLVRFLIQTVSLWLDPEKKAELASLRFAVAELKQQRDAISNAAKKLAEEGKKGQNFYILTFFHTIQQPKTCDCSWTADTASSSPHEMNSSNRYKPELDW